MIVFCGMMPDSSVKMWISKKETASLLCNVLYPKPFEGKPKLIKWEEEMSRWQERHTL